MPKKGFTWNEEYRKHYYSSEKVQAHLENFMEYVKQPKPASQREKMSIAKKGKKFSEQHKQNMSETQKFRQAIKQEILLNEPDLPKDKLWERVREEMKNSTT